MPPYLLPRLVCAITVWVFLVSGVTLHAWYHVPCMNMNPSFYHILQDHSNITCGEGGGVVAEIFRDRRKPGRLSGGGVVAEISRDRRKPGRFRGGGSSRIFWASPITVSQPHSVGSGRFFLVFG